MIEEEEEFVSASDEDIERLLVPDGTPKPSGNDRPEEMEIAERELSGLVEAIAYCLRQRKNSKLNIHLDRLEVISSDLRFRWDEVDDEDREQYLSDLETAFFQVEGVIGVGSTVEIRRAMYRWVDGTVGDSITRARKTIKFLRNSRTDHVRHFTSVDQAVKIRRLIPDQRDSPIYFKVVDGVLRVRHSYDRAPDDSAVNVEHARKALLGGSERLLEYLRDSNCDKRLIETFEAVHLTLSSQNDVIQLGILNITCQHMGNAFGEELSKANTSLMNGQINGISMYLAQFPQWNFFVDNAAKAAINADDVATIYNSAMHTMKMLDRNPLIDPEVPRLIRLLLRAMENPALEAKRGAFAMMRTIENLVAAVYRYGADFVIDAATRTRRQAAKAVSAVVVAGLLGLALQSAGGVEAVAGKLIGSSWMNTVAQSVEKQIEMLQK